MFGIGGFEFAAIVVLALVLFGPDKLPDLARKLGRLYGDFKRYTDTMESIIRAEVREGEKESVAKAKETPAKPAAAPAAFEDDDDDEEEEE